MNPYTLKVEAEIFRRSAVLWTFIVEVYWACLLLFSSPAPSDTGIQVLTVVIGVSLGAAAWRAGAAIADGVRVFATLRTPNTLWREWLRKVTISLALRGGMALVAGSVAVMRHGATWTWSAPAALYSVILVVALVASLGHHGLWHWMWGWGSAAVVAVAIALAGVQGFEAWMHGAPAGHLGLAFVCVGAVSVTLLRWRSHPPTAVHTRRDSQPDPLRRCINYGKRFSLLNPVRQQLLNRQGNPWLGLATALPAGYAMVGRAVALKAHWGAAAGILYLLSLLAPVAFALTTIACKDLHWRRLLAPGGFTSGRLGSHIILSTLEVNAASVVLIAACVGVLIATLRWAGVPIVASVLLHSAVTHGVIVVEYLMAICIAAALRSMHRPVVVYVSALLVLSVLSLGALLVPRYNPWATFFVIGPGYVACLLAVSGIAILLANRLWTIERLLPYLVTRAPQDGEATVQGRWFNWPGRSY